MRIDLKCSVLITAVLNLTNVGDGVALVKVVSADLVQPDYALIVFGLNICIAVRISILGEAPISIELSAASIERLLLAQIFYFVVTSANHILSSTLPPKQLGYPLTSPFLVSVEP
jgi:hypothetical protein